MNFKLVPMDRSNVADVEAIERECFAQPWSADMLAQELYNDSASYILAVAEDGTALGYAGLTVVLDEGSIDKVAVKGKYRRMGVADALVDAFVRFGRAHLAFLTLEVRASNQAAIALYLKHGFTQVGRRKNYYAAEHEDAILMTLEFRPEEPRA
ncbi:MAG TPA: ribosomal protein S18-alanine N-acetyltransferase [Candidatus Galloscillospira excrementavium]|nr:ribosomal protein S18-alanine N-acetyltransferase [Candidatus Galloscillospira excrementavium]